jgi:hypothetical protein
MVALAFRDLREMPQPQRQATLNSDRFRDQFSDQERNTIHYIPLDYGTADVRKLVTVNLLRGEHMSQTERLGQPHRTSSSPPLR